jgi:hypothetical protein
MATFALIRSIVAETGLDVETMPLAAVRSALTRPLPPGAELAPTATSWRRLQLRQLFRLSLEAMFHWVTLLLQDGPMTSSELANVFVRSIDADADGTAAEWLIALHAVETEPVELLQQLEAALSSGPPSIVPRLIATGLAVALSDPLSSELRVEHGQRLPLARACREAESRKCDSIDEFVRHVLESWVLAQHAYWAASRGLADARSLGRSLLRLRVAMEEGGWTLTGAPVGVPPRATPDRLATAIALGREAGLL